MNVENLKRASEIKAQIDALQAAADKLENNFARIWVSRDCSCDERFCTALGGDYIIRDFRRFIDEHIEVLLEEAKTL